MKITNFYILVKNNILFKNISLEVNEREIIFLKGDNGLGKSTFFKAILDLLFNKDFQIKGQISFKGQEDIRNLLGKKIAFLPQDISDIFNHNKKMSYQLLYFVKDKTRLNFLLEALNLSYLKDNLNKYPYEFSQGELQRLAIVSILMPKPIEFVIMDEPTSFLDEKNKEALISLVKSLQKEKNIRFLISSHDNYLIEKLADKVFIIKNKEIVLQTSNIKEEDNFLNGFEEFKVGALQKYIIKNFNIKQGDILIIKDLNFSFKEKQNIAIVGRSGIGKSTLALGLINFLNSSYKIVGQCNFSKNAGLTLQDYSNTLSPHMLVKDILFEAFRIKDRKSSRFYFYKKVLPMIAKVNLDKRILKNYANKLSKGQKQKVILIRSLLAYKDVIIFDEITSSLDGNSKENILELLQDFQRKYPITYIFLTHNKKVLDTMVEKIIFLKENLQIKYYTKR